MEIITCKTCGKNMIGYSGDGECSECAFPALKIASEAAARSVEKGHFERTGESKTCGEILRNAMGIL